MCKHLKSGYWTGCDYWNRCTDAVRGGNELPQWMPCGEDDGLPQWSYPLTLSSISRPLCPDNMLYRMETNDYK